jgi:membrane dipeptidase
VEDTAAIETALDATPFATILTVEGGSALAGKLENVDRLYELGVRMMGLTWNATNEIAGGADTDEGFTPFGREVVQRMEQLGMAVDVSHLSDRAFWELCEFAEKPFLASHSNSRAVCCHRRNLTDDMFREIVRRGGIVGLNYSVNFLKDGGVGASFDDLLRHTYHFLELGGGETLSLGSDFDGTDIPTEFDRLDKLDFLIDAFDRSGIPPATVEAILFENANRYLSNIPSCPAVGGVRQKR